MLPEAIPAKGVEAREGHLPMDTNLWNIGAARLDVANLSTVVFSIILVMDVLKLFIANRTAR
jgi:hypothetical protein